MSTSDAPCVPGVKMPRSASQRCCLAYAVRTSPVGENANRARDLTSSAPRTEAPITTVDAGLTSRLDQWRKPCVLGSHIDASGCSAQGAGS